MRYRLVVIVIIVMIVLGGLFFVSEKYFFEENDRKELGGSEIIINDSFEDGQDIKEEEHSSEEDEVIATDDNQISDESVVEIGDELLDIPFVCQAPFGEWANPVYQNGCEEAASLMAVYWALGRDLNKEGAKQEIMAIVDYQKEKFGGYEDTSAQDTVERIIKGYFEYENVEVKEVGVVEDIIKEVKKSRAVIVPANGRLLGNPYYTSPGPERHNLVIRGYDIDKDEFITNDPGTKKGEMYRYKKEVLFKAIRDYPTGYHQPIIKIEKMMIVVF